MLDAFLYAFDIIACAIFTRELRFFTWAKEADGRMMPDISNFFFI